MTEQELIEALRPHVARIAEAVRVRSLPSASTFAAASQDETPDEPAGFTASDLVRFHDYYSAAEDGTYPGHLHRAFGCGIKAFADATGLRRRAVSRDGRQGWTWVRPPEPALKSFADRSGLTLAEVKPGIHRWVKADTGDEHESHPETGEHATAAAVRHGSAPGRAAGDAYLEKLLAEIPNHQQSNARGLVNRIGDAANRAMVKHATAFEIGSIPFKVADALLTTPEDVQKYPWLAGKFGANSQATGDALGDSIGVPGHLASRLIATAVVKAWAAIRDSLGGKKSMADGADDVGAVAAMLTDVVNAVRGEVGMPPVDGSDIRDGVASLVGAKTFADDPDAEPDLNAAIGEAMVALALDAAESGDDPHEGLERLRALLHDPDALAELSRLINGEGETATFAGGHDLRRIAESPREQRYAMFAEVFASAAKSWDPSLHPRGKGGHFISKDRIAEAKDNPRVADQLRKEVKPEDAGKLEKALKGETDLGRTKRGEAMHAAAKRREERRSTREAAEGVIKKLTREGDLKGTVSADDLHALADHLQSGHMSVADLRRVKDAMRGATIKAGFGGAKNKAGMVAALVAHAKGEAFERRLKEQGVTGDDADAMRVAAGLRPKVTPETPAIPVSEVPVPTTGQLGAWGRAVDAARAKAEADSPRPAPEHEPAAGAAEPVAETPKESPVASEPSGKAKDAVRGLFDGIGDDTGAGVADEQAKRGEAAKDAGDARGTVKEDISHHVEAFKQAKERALTSGGMVGGVRMKQDVTHAVAKQLGIPYHEAEAKLEEAAASPPKSVPPESVPVVQQKPEKEEPKESAPAVPSSDPVPSQVAKVKKGPHEMSKQDYVAKEIDKAARSAGSWMQARDKKESAKKRAEAEWENAIEKAYIAGEKTAEKPGWAKTGVEWANHPAGPGPAEPIHRKEVADALAAGKPVPPEVLADYPDLAAKAIPPEAQSKPGIAKDANAHLPRVSDARKRYDDERIAEGSPRRFDQVASDMRAAGGTDKDIQDFINIYAPEKATPPATPVKSADDHYRDLMGTLQAGVTRGGGKVTGTSEAVRKKLAEIPPEMRAGVDAQLRGNGTTLEQLERAHAEKPVDVQEREKNVAKVRKEVVGTQPMSQPRAKHGEIGPNGEVYPGGAFIATQDIPKRMKDKLQQTARGSVRVGKEGKAVPDPGKMSIVDKLGGTVMNPRTGEVNEQYLNYIGATPEQRVEYAELAAKHKAGEEWVSVNDYPSLANLTDAARLYVSGKPIPGAVLDKLPEDFRSRLSKYTQPSDQGSDPQQNPVGTAVARGRRLRSADDARPTEDEIAAAMQPAAPAAKPAFAPDMAMLDQPAGAVEPGSRTGDAVARADARQEQRSGTPPQAASTVPESTAIPATLPTIRVQHGKGYTGRLGNKSHVAKINGLHPQYGLDRDFLKADRMDWGDSEFYRKNKGTYHAVHDVSPNGGVYEVNEHGDKNHTIFYPHGGTVHEYPSSPTDETLKRSYKMLDDAGLSHEDFIPAIASGHGTNKKIVERVADYIAAKSQSGSSG